ncbi:MAG: AraC family transcriptional regulator [Paenibacillus sp.]|jgi:AraC family transcriptional activator of pobA|nr:AraC family transcriptional regulator [Paenibacillus sp.]
MKPEVLSAFFGTSKLQSKVEPHTHDYWQLEIVTHSVLRSGLLGEEHLLEPGDMLLVPPGWMHEFMYDNPGIGWITLKFALHADDLPLWGGAIRGNPYTSRLISSFKTAIHGSANKYYEKVFVNGFIETIFHYIHSDDFRPADVPTDLLVKLVTEKVLMRNGRAITVNELAEELAYTRSHLSKKFKEITGNNLKSYIDQVRVQKIEELLLYREHSISEIAADMGFNDLFSFSRFVKKHTGVSPRQYKRTASSAASVPAIGEAERSKASVTTPEPEPAPLAE